MRLDREHQDLVNEIYDEAIIDHGKDHIAAACAVVKEIEALEAGGHRWAKTVLDAALLDGIKRRVKTRAKRSVISVPSKNGKQATMPARYSSQKADGTRQLELWLDLPLDELAALAESLGSQLGTLGQRKNRMERGIALATEHDKPTAREGFEAEGVAIDEVAA